MLGRGVEQDDTEAVRWLRKSAVQGYAPAQFFLGMMIFEGRGIDQDRIAGYAWIHLAAENRLDDALELRDRLREQLEPLQIQIAERHSGSLLRAGSRAVTRNRTRGGLVRKPGTRVSPRKRRVTEKIG